MSVKVIIFVVSLLQLVISLTYAQNCSATLPPLPEDIVQAKADIIQLALDNVDKWGDPTIQSLINEKAAVIENWFINNRPDNELELTTGPWYAAWYEDVSLFPSGRLFRTDRENTYQVVREGFYYNIAKFDYGLLFTGTITNFLKGEFTIKDPKGPTTCGQKRRNIIDLRFTSSSIRSGFIPVDIPLTDTIDAIDAGTVRKGLIRFPTGRFNTGDLWNLFVDEELRVCYGIDDGSAIDEGGMFILIRQELPS